MIRVLLIITTVLMATASFGGQVGMEKYLLTPQEKEQLLNEKRLLEPGIQRRMAQLREDELRRLDLLKREYEGRVERGESKPRAFHWFASSSRKLTLEYGRKRAAVQKPLRGIESKLQMDKVARQAIAYSKATPQERLEVDMDNLRLQILNQQDELDQLKEQQERSRLW